MLQEVQELGNTFPDAAARQVRKGSMVPVQTGENLPVSASSSLLSGPVASDPAENLAVFH